ncbi:hypothetical protein Barb6_01666 [Bacteroidales bacterium Barb6]|nr:hypothetical protein Barb6_01666 [Bacteroidales bacterium Barb6]
MNCDKAFVPKNELTTEEIVFALIKSIGVNTSLSRTFMRSRTVRDIRASPTPNWLYSCSPTVRTRRLLKWSISSTIALELINSIRYLMISIISSFVSTFTSLLVVSPNFLLIR